MKKKIINIVILGVLLIPKLVSAQEIQFSFYANGGTTSTPNFEINEEYGFISYNGTSFSSYNEKSTIKSINSISGKKFALTKPNDTLVSGREWYMTNYYDGKVYYFNEKKTYKIADIMKQLSIEDNNFVSYSVYANWNSKKKTGGIDIKNSGSSSTTSTTTNKSNTNNTKHYVNIKYHVNNGTLITPHSSYITIVNNYVYYKGKILTTKIAYNEKMVSGGLANYNNPEYLNLGRNGYNTDSGIEWNTKANGTGKSYNQATAYKASDFCDAKKNDCTVTIYVNWKKTPTKLKSLGKITPSKLILTLPTVKSGNTEIRTTQGFAKANDYYFFCKKNGTDTIGAILIYKGKKHITTKIIKKELGHCNDLTYNEKENKIYTAGFKTPDSKNRSFSYSEALNGKINTSREEFSVGNSGIAYDKTNGLYYFGSGKKVYIFNDRTKIRKFEKIQADTPQGIAAYKGKVLVIRYGGGSAGGPVNKTKNAIDIYRASNGDYLGSYIINTGMELEALDWSGTGNTFLLQFVNGKLYEINMKIPN